VAELCGVSHQDAGVFVLPGEPGGFAETDTGGSAVAEEEDIEFYGRVFDAG
jgi:hypothetical protein